MTRRKPTSHELALWQGVVRDVKPLRPRARTDTVLEAASPGEPLDEAASLDLPSTKPPPRPLPPLPRVFDRETERRLKSGRARPEARIDLHGLTEGEAHKALSAFVARSAREGCRLALVITGKGRMGEGILRRNLPLWLEAPALRPLLVAARPAFDRDGGEGAFYLLFRRNQRSG